VKDREGQIIAISNHLGRILFKRGEFSVACDIWQEGLTIAKELKSHNDISYHLGSLAVIEAKHGQWSNAEKLWEEGLSISERTGFREQICTHLQNVGWERIVKGDPSFAVEPLQRGLNLGREIGLKAQVSFILANLGFALAAVGEARQASLCLEESVSIARSIGRPWLRSAVLIIAADQELTAGMIDSAADHYREASELAKKYGHKEHIATAEYGFARVNAIKNIGGEWEMNLRSALHYFDAERHYLTAQANTWLLSKQMEYHQIPA
jgi:tetratricopeptide (TPR) repeat protein